MFKWCLCKEQEVSRIQLFLKHAAPPAVQNQQSESVQENIEMHSENRRIGLIYHRTSTGNKLLLINKNKTGKQLQQTDLQERENGPVQLVHEFISVTADYKSTHFLPFFLVTG